METIDQLWEKALASPIIKIVEYLDRRIPNVPLTPELKLYLAIFEVPSRNRKWRLIEVFLSVHEPKGEWEEYKRNCTEWVSSLLKRSVNLETDLIKEDIHQALLALSKREQLVLNLRFGFDGQSLTQAQVAPHLQVTREKIQRIEAKALRKLRHLPRLRGLKYPQPGKWLRSKVFNECARQPTVPVLFLYWDGDREELKRVKGEKERIDNQARLKEAQLNYLKTPTKGRLLRPITELGLTTRTAHALQRSWGRHIPTLGEVAALSDDELLGLWGFGQKCLVEVREKLQAKTKAF